MFAFAVGVGNWCTTCLSSPFAGTFAQDFAVPSFQSRAVGVGSIFTAKLSGVPPCAKGFDL